MLTGFIAQIAGLLLGQFANAFPSLAGVFSSLIASFAKDEAAALHKAMTFFHDKLAGGASWEDSVTATLNEIGTAEYAVLTDVATHLLQAFMHKSKA